MNCYSKQLLRNSSLTIWNIVNPLYTILPIMEEDYHECWQKYAGIFRSRNNFCKEINLDIHQRFIITIEDLGEGGEGIGKIDGLTVFVPGVVLGDEVEIEIRHSKKNYAVGEVTQLIKPSPFRVSSPCPDFPECGGCQILDMAYQAQLDWKKQHLIQTLQRIGQITADVEDVIGMEHPYHYRNKMSYPVDPTKIGLYQRGSHDIVAITDCQVHPQGVDRVLTLVRQHLNKTITGYDEATHRGGLRHVMVRYGFDRQEMMIVLVTCDQTDLTPLVEELQSLADVRTIIENKNTAQGNRILGPRNIVHYGDGVIEEELDDDTFAIDPYSFYQVNTVQLKKLYQLVREMAQLQGNELVYDIYAGLGTIGSYLSRESKRVVSIEIVPQAVTAGAAAAKKNKRDNMDFILGKAEEVIVTLNEQGLQPDLVVVDPPRKGLDQKLITSLLETMPETIIYVSCKPSTLARDLKQFCQGGYRVERIQPLDLFPHTTHVECVVLMSRVEK